MAQPNHDDVVVRQHSGKRATFYLLGSSSDRNHLVFDTRDEAVWHAFTSARRRGVRAWFDKGNEDFVLLATFTKEQAEPLRSS